MTFTASFSATDRFSMVLDGLRKAVAARIVGGAMQAAMIVLVWARLRRIETRVLRLIAQVRAGFVPVERVKRLRAEGAARVASPRVPRRFAWLCQMVPYEAAGFASQLRHLLGEPEMVALLAAEPRIGRVLRPLCRMLGLEAGLVAPVVAAAPVAAPVADACAVSCEGAVLMVASGAIGFEGDAMEGRWGGRIFDPA